MKYVIKKKFKPAFKVMGKTVLVSQCSITFQPVYRISGHSYITDKASELVEMIIAANGII